MRILVQPNSTWNPGGIHMDSNQIPPGIHLDSHYSTLFYFINNNIKNVVSSRVWTKDLLNIKPAINTTSSRHRIVVWKNNTLSVYTARRSPAAA